MRGDWLWWLSGAMRLCSKLLLCRSLGRETARRLTRFFHWLINRLHVLWQEVVSAHVHTSYGGKYL